MGRSSQLHKLNVHGQNSSGQVAPSLKSLDQHGTDVLSATILVSGLGNVGDGLDATVNIGAADLISSYTVLAAREATSVMATGLAAAIQAQVDVTATSTGTVVYITKSTSGSVAVVSTGIS